MYNILLKSVPYTAGSARSAVRSICCWHLCVVCQMASRNPCFIICSVFCERYRQCEPHCRRMTIRSLYFPIFARALIGHSWQQSYELRIVFFGTTVSSMHVAGKIRGIKIITPYQLQFGVLFACGPRIYESSLKYGTHTSRIWFWYRCLLEKLL